MTLNGNINCIKTSDRERVCVCVLTWEIQTDIWNGKPPMAALNFPTKFKTRKPFVSKKMFPIDFLRGVFFFFLNCSVFVWRTDEERLYPSRDSIPQLHYSSTGVRFQLFSNSSILNENGSSCNYRSFTGDYARDVGNPSAAGVESTKNFLRKNLRQENLFFGNLKRINLVFAFRLIGLSHFQQRSNAKGNFNPGSVPLATCSRMWRTSSVAHFENF